MDTTTDAREYLRVSRDRSGRERSNDEQTGDNRAVWDDWTWASPYSDATSASRYARKERGDWPRLIADLKADRFGARRLVLWESSRGSRKVGEWVELLDLLEQRSVLVAVTEHRRIYDPANPRDRRSLLEDAVDSEYESAKSSGRLKRNRAADAAAGRPHGRIPYGYRSVYDPASGRLVGREPEPAEAAVVVEVFERIRKGHSIRSIARDLAARGVEKRSGGPFSPQHLRTLVKADLYRGKRSWAPGSKHRPRPGDAVTVTDAQWPALVSETLWLAVQRTLDDPSRRTVRPGRATHLLSMVTRCDVCSGPMCAVTRRGSTRREYICRDGGHVRVDADELDALAEAAMLGYLARPDNVERLTADDGNGEALEAARLDVARTRAELDDLAEQVGAGTLSATLAARAEPVILARLKVAEARVSELATPSRLRGLIEPGKGVARRWKAAPMSARRTIARMLLASDVLGEMRVGRSPIPRHRVPVEDRVVWRQG